MFIIYNMPALGFALVGFVVGCIVHLIVGSNGSADLILGALTMGLCDVVYRLATSSGELWKRIILPRNGGHVFFCPVWIWGILWALLFRGT